MRKYIIPLLIIIMLLLADMNVLAEVHTTEKTEGFSESVYVAGNPNMYPIEFYDEDKEEYRGIIPDMLKIISENSGIDFVYINGNKNDKTTMAENLQVDMVSALDFDEANPSYKDYLELIAFKKDGRGVKCGIAFTALINDDVIAKIKESAEKISPDEKSGIYLSYATEEKKVNAWWIAIGIGVNLILLIFVISLFLRINKIRKKNMMEKMTDSKTGMGNLEFFDYHFKNTISDVSKSLYYIAYIMLDSAYICSYYGDDSLEDIVKYTAAVIAEHTEEKEISARVSENGFAFAYQSTNTTDAKKRIEEIISKLNRFENLGGEANKKIFHAAVYHLEANDRNDEILLFNLRKNCKRIVGTGVQIIYCDSGNMKKIQEEKKITESILKGFESNEFKMYVQFIVDNNTKKIVSAEALSRWENPKKGLVRPNEYIANMELAGLITKHDLYMFEIACRQLEQWRETELGNIRLSCNFTRITLSEENFIDKIKMIANSYNFDKSNLAIEITEDVMESDREIATKNVIECKKLGFCIYLDDLGSGYTSLSNLCDYPIDVVKIDRDILLKTDTQRGKDLFSGIIALAHNLNIRVICEGVETEEQNNLVSESDCDYIQGWYYSKALPLEECESFYKNYGI